MADGNTPAAAGNLKKQLARVTRKGSSARIKDLEQIAEKLDCPLWVLFIPDVPETFWRDKRQDGLMNTVREYVDGAQPDHKAMAISLENMDSMTQDIVEKIHALAALAARELKSRENGKSDFQHVLAALSMIDYWAEDISNFNNCEAENHGCNYIDPERKVARA